MKHNVTGATSLLMAAMLLGFGAAACRGGTTGGAAASGGEVVATIAGTPVTRAELEVEASSRLFGLRTQEYEVREQLVRELITDRLLRQEAEARGLTVEKLLVAEVDEKARPVTEAEVKAHYESVKERVKNRPMDQVLKEIESSFKRGRLEERRREYVAGLLRKSRVQLSLDPPRAKVEVGDAPVAGPAQAPVTIIEFSDYQCPYCARAEKTLAQVRARYGDKLRVAFRHLPLQSIHPNAAKAAEAASCAVDQGKFWEMSDSLFAHQQELDPEGLKRRAAEVGLDQQVFAECLDSGRKAGDVQRDLAAAEELGLGGTPAFFINGRLVKGALPAERFAELIDDELERAASAAAARRP